MEENIIEKVRDPKKQREKERKIEWVMDSKIEIDIAIDSER